MSYGFTVNGATKADAKARVSAEFDKVVSTQPMHETDREQAQEAVRAFIDLLPDDTDSSIGVAVNGSVMWEGTQADPVIRNASVSISVSLATVPASRSVP